MAVPTLAVHDVSRDVIHYVSYRFHGYVVPPHNSLFFSRFKYLKIYLLIFSDQKSVNKREDFTNPMRDA